MSNTNLYTAKEIRQKYKISNQTLYNWRKANKIEYIVLPSGSYMYKDYSEEDKKSERKNVIYARVSNTKQKEDLVRQEQVIRDYMVSNGIIVDEVYSDIASGMNTERKDFNQLLEDCISGKINTIYISYKDRFVRFGFEYFLKFLDNFDVTIEILNSTAEEDFQSELTEDLISIINHFSIKMYSQRRKQLNAIKKELEK